METINLNQACNIITGELDSNQSSLNGKYPFFTCAPNPERINHYAYDDDVILIAGNNAQGNFHLNRYKGKFNAYQRTYIVSTKKEFDINYIYYSLKLELDRLKNRSQGSQTKFLTMPIINSIQIRNTKFEDQIKISSLMYKIDKKIYKLKFINEKIRNLIQLMYNYWFLQFDYPNSKGRPYKSSGGKMIWNNKLKTEIPENWEVKKLSDLITLGKKTIEPMQFPNVSFNYFNIPWFDKHNSYQIEKGINIKSNKFIVEENDILISKLNPKFNRVIYSSKIKNLICSTEFVIWKNESKFLKNYYYSLSKNKLFNKYIVQSSTGTSNSHRRINPKIMMDFKIAYNERIFQKYGKEVNSLIQLLSINEKETQKLQNKLSNFLPLLINGQIKIK